VHVTLVLLTLSSQMLRYVPMYDNSR